MKRIWAIAMLTLKAAYRFRLVRLLEVLLLGSVVVLPMIIKDDGTARGFTQILLTYTLGVITVLLGFSTLWLACGTLAGDIEECQMQMVAVKPIARWQIWLGKWLGIMLMNTLLLALAGGSVFALLQWRARKLPAEQLTVLRNEVLVARGSAREPQPDWEPIVEKIYQQRLKESSVPAVDRPLLRRQIAERAKAELQLVPASFLRRWEIPLGAARHGLRDQPLYVRTKFQAAKKQPGSSFDAPKTYRALWQIGPPGTAQVVRQEMSTPAESFSEFEIPPNLFDERGILTLEFWNANEETLLFPLEDGMEVLYREGSFGLNYCRGLFIILCWLALLTALGLAAASFLSFPVASFLALGVLIVGLSSGTLSQIIEQGGIVGINQNTGQVDNPTVIDRATLPLFQGLLRLINLVQGFSPIDALSTGRSVTWEQTGLALAQIVLLLGGLFAAVGITLFTRRELATAQGTQ